MKPSKDMIDFVSSRDARSFTQAVNNILNTKAALAVDSIRPKVASDMFKSGYYPKSGDEQKFVDKHTFDVIDYPVQNENGLPFRDDSAPHKSAKENNRANYDRGEDTAKYEEVQDTEEKLVENSDKDDDDKKHKGKKKFSDLFKKGNAECK